MKMRSLTALSGSVVLALSLAACSGSNAESADSEASEGCPDGSLTFGVEPYEDPKNLTPVYEKVGEALGEALDCDIEVEVVESYVGEILAMKNGKLDIGQFGPLGYVFAQREAGAVAVASFADEDGELSSYTAGIWASKDSGIESVEDLAGKSLALGSTGSTSGDALPRQQIVDAGIESDVETTYAGGHVEAMLALTNDKVDAAQVNSQTLASAAEEGTFNPDDYVQVWESDPIANDPITVSPDMSDEAREAVVDALLNLDQDVVAEIGTYLDFESPESPIIEVDQSTYKPMFDLADSLGLTADDL